MNLLSGLFGHLSPAVAYTVVAGVVLAESVLLTAVFVPTLTLLLTAGALARTGQLSLPLVVASAAGAAIAGDFLAHRTGWHLGKRLRTARMARRIPAAAWQRAETLMTRHGGRAVFLARLLPMVRTLAPHFAAPPACPTAASPPTASPPPACGPRSKPASATAPRPPSSGFSPWAAPPWPWSS
ncbi:DedA family protein [Kitasatospora gansuensis]